MKLLKKLFSPVKWHNLRVTKPVSTVFGFDRGTPVDRYYIEKFLRENSVHIKGRVLEIENSTYSKKFGTAVTQFDVLHYTDNNSSATIIGDLTKKETLPEGAVDCFICTQTFNFIYDFKEGIKGAYHLLKKDGRLLVTLAGVCQISQYDMKRWGDFWRFTTRSAEEAFGEVFGKENIKVGSFGNVLTSVGLLHGISSEEFTSEELDFRDDTYQVIITIVAKKC